MTIEILKRNKLHDCLISVFDKKSVTKRKLQNLIGKLNWATQCIYGGHFHMTRLINKTLCLQCAWHIGQG